ncbi:MAG TPA: Fe-S cluster assembly ATPase SufC [Actinomycetes bacterium]|jgi:Fe-S cluster assembly ATP-binding protein|nr:Fe-S cluster assembly ATPase SufC [Actinomycetes bacterium]
MSDANLVIEDLHVKVEDKEILHGLDLVVEPGRVHALMGPNGSGKSTLAYALAGHPRYAVTGGKVTFEGQDVLQLTPDDRARLGMFLAMQYPVEVPGVSVTNFLRTAVNAVRGEDVPVRQFARDLREQLRALKMDPKLAERSLNEGFSGGEKKRHEILQMALLRPRLAILDETDSGLDIDALRVVSQGVNRLRGPELAVLLITHYTRILRYIDPDRVHVMVGGRIVQSGGAELADELEERGYERWRAAQVA